jgi:hypothetical protein
MICSPWLIRLFNESGNQVFTSTHQELTVGQTTESV